MRFEISNNRGIQKKMCAGHYHTDYKQMNFCFYIVVFLAIKQFICNWANCVEYSNKSNTGF